MKSQNQLTQKETKKTKAFLRSSWPLLAYVKTFICFAFLAYFAVNLHAQTTLSGDHIITGDLSVGTTGTNGNLTVTGEAGGTAAPGLTVTGDGGVVFTGSFGVGQIPATGPGTRFMWYPKKAALRAGKANATEWNEANIGDYSIALGYNAIAASEGSVAIGYNSIASGYSSIALGDSMAGGYNSIAMSGGFVAYEEAATAMSSGTTMSWICTAMSGGTASSAYSVAMGEGTFIHSYRSVVVGSYNKTIGEESEDWLTEDPIFVVGNGTGEPEDPLEIRYRDAFVIRKNGNFEMNGKITMPRQGDILMGEFGNPE